MKKTHLTCEDIERLLMITASFMDNTIMSYKIRTKFQNIRLKLAMMKAETEYLNKRRESA